MLSQNLMKNAIAIVGVVAMIEVIERHEYREPEYFIKCSCCQSILKFAKSDAFYEDDSGYRGSYYLKCPVCGSTNYLGLRNEWRQSKGEL